MASNIQTPLGTSVIVPLPDVFGGFRVNDIVLVFVYAMWNVDFGADGPIQAPLEWTAIDNAEVDYSLVQVGLGDRMGAWYFPVTVDGVGPSDLEFAWQFPAAFVARAVVYRNVNAADPILNQPIQVGLSGNDPATVDVSVATIVPNTRVVVAMAARSGQNDTAFNINDDSVGNPKFNRRSQSMTNDQTDPQYGSFPAFGSYPDQGSPDLANLDYGSLSVSDRVYSLPATPIITGSITTGNVTGLSTQAMGLAIRLNEAS